MKISLRIFAALIFGILMSAGVYAQNSVSATWALQGDQTVTTSGKIGAADESFTGLKVGYDGSATFGTLSYSNIQKFKPADNGGAWTAATTQQNDHYIQFAVAAPNGYKLDINSISFLIGAKGTYNLKANFAYSTDTAASSYTVLDTGVVLPHNGVDTMDIMSASYSPNVTLNPGDSLYFRIYPYNVTGDNGSTSKYVYLQNVSIGGTSTSLNIYSASATWPLTDPDNGGTGLSAVIAGQVAPKDEYLNNMIINHYSGPNNSQRMKISDGKWPANQTTQLDTVFVQFAVSPKTGFKFNVKSISFNMAAASINTMKANVYYSTDSTFTNATQVNYTTGVAGNYVKRDTLTPVTASPNVTVNPGQTFYVRIYPWVDGDPNIRTGKYICLQDIVIGGNVEGLPLPATVTWPLQSDENPVTSGQLVANPQSYSYAMKLYNFNNFPTTSGYTVNAATIQTVSKSWTAATAPVDSLYFQYAVSPKFGGTFYTDSVSFYLGGWFSSNFKASIYYSKDSTFQTKHVLFADTTLDGHYLVPFNSALSDTVNTGETLYLRVYPYDTKSEGWAKLIAVDSVRITGRTTGVTADPPVVTTADISEISTVFAVGGGTVPSDGGAPVTARGVVWDTASSPTLANSKTVDGTGSGSFKSKLTGLTAGMTYHVRAYATNDAGTSYGNEVTFKTLDSLLVPTVTTSAVSNVLVKQAQSGGNVLAWGGDTVKARGVCWNTTGDPTIADSKTVNGNKLGSYSSTLYPLQASTKYYVRAYATNSIGTGYGLVDTFQTQTPAPLIRKVVAKDGSGDYKTVQAAFDAVPDFYTGPYEIYVKNGVYKEKLFLGQNKVNVTLIGESKDSTILTYDDYAGKNNLGTSGSYSTSIDASDFTAMNITFQNTVVNDGSVGSQQAVALETNGDRQSYYNCNILGYQDTYYARGAHGTDRIYMNHCLISGSVDFIFGRDIVVFDSCEIHINRNTGSLTAASTEPISAFGFVFRNGTISADSIGFDGNAITSFDLGRPWQGAPRVVFMNTYEPASVAPEGWTTMQVKPKLFAEYKCYGPGYKPTDRTTRWGDSVKVLSDQEASAYTLQNIFSKNSNPNFGYDWMPKKTLITGVKSESSLNQKPHSYQLYQNYPNPFNPTTMIRFAVPHESHVVLNIYNILGQKVTSLVNREMKTGTYNINFDASRLSSGVYFYTISAGNFNATKKMLLLK